MMTAHISRLYAALPHRTVGNQEVANLIGRSPEWIEQRTGIRERRWVDGEETSAKLATRAARALLRDQSATVDVVVMATDTPDHGTPASAARVAALLGLSTVPAFDLHAVCSGFVHAVVTATALVNAEVAATVLVLAGDVYSTIIGGADPGPKMLFGDGAAACLVSSQPIGPRVEAWDWGGDGLAYDLITRAGGEEGGKEYFVMQGGPVFVRAVQEMCDSIQRCVAAAALGMSDVDLVVPHQANGRILSAVGSRLPGFQGQVLNRIATVGNTVSASIPLAVALAGDPLPDRAFGSEPVTVFTAFGGGLSWGSVLLRGSVQGCLINEEGQ